MILAGTAYGTASGRAGEYRIANVPPGSYTFTVNYIGYEDYSIEITLAEDESIIHDAALNVSYITMDEIIVQGLAQGQAKALSQQKSAVNITNIVSSDQIERFPDPNIAEALQRIPAISIQRDHGEGRYVLIRGTEARLNSTMINGVRIPSPEDDNRNVSLDVIPSNLMQMVEVSKALTPDMDGDAIGGSVNLVTKNAFDYDGQILNLNLNGGYRNLRGDAGGQAAVTYANQFMDGKLGFLVSGSYHSADMATDNIELEWDEDEFNGSDETILDDMQLRHYNLNRTRIGLTTSLNFKPNDQSSYYLTGLYNNYTDMEDRNRLRFRFGKGDYDSPTEVSGARMTRDLKHRKSVSIIQHIAAGGKHLFPKFELDYTLSTSFADEKRDPSKDISFVQKKYDFKYDISDPDNPTVEVTNDLDYNDLSGFKFDDMEQKDGEYTFDRDRTFAINLKAPL
ncbi:MAG: TonB-dependent receptor plug domain-containing protein [Candidatus Marinimicrobia bacterium]|nr:TonB-dependent receptor plug domain-containing protein [Candidatus Neomarinimicrobiota bacterium]